MAVIRFNKIIRSYDGTHNILQLSSTATSFDPVTNLKAGRPFAYQREYAFYALLHVYVHKAHHDNVIMRMHLCIYLCVYVCARLSICALLCVLVCPRMCAYMSLFGWFQFASQ